MLLVDQAARIVVARAGGLGNFGRLQTPTQQGLQSLFSSRPNWGGFRAASNPCWPGLSVARPNRTSYRRLPLAGGTTVCPVNTTEKVTFPPCEWM